jgi:radical SAM superfamily enzyme YgiQ (UPF0313 family)
MRILFIYPDIITLHGLMNFCPAVHILSSVLKRKGCQVDLLHINNEHSIKYDKDTILNLTDGYDLFAVTATSFSYKYAHEIAGWLKEKHPSVLRILGGCHATIMPEDFESSNFDIFCVGEGEEPMKELVNALWDGKDWTKIPNFITRYGTNPVRGFLRDLDSLPYQDFEITDTKKILELRKGWLSLSFSRGCPYECSFCINHLYKKVEIGKDDKMSDYLRRRSPENAVSELESIISKYDVKYFNIDDDLLTIDKKWMKEFTDKYTERIFKPYGIKYILNARATTIDDPLAKMLSTSGCREVRIGFETGNEKLRNDLLFKKVTDKSLIKACNILDKYNIMSVFFMMIGIPGESWSTFFETVDMTILLKPKLIRMTFLYPYVHTRIYDYCIENGLFREGEIDDNNDIASPLVFDNLTDEELFCMKFLFVWYVNARWFGGNYQRAIDSYKGLPLSKLKELIPGIIERDRLMSKKCTHSHYRYYGGNPNYFELYDYLKNTI